MIGITRTLRPLRSESDGLTLVEVVVAMFIFAIISTGALYTMGSILTVTRDSRAKEVAANLAAQEIDLSRSAADLFNLEDADKSYTLNGDVFSLHRETEWVDGTGTDVACGVNGGTLKYKRVNVTVTWGGMRAGSPPVRSDTVIDPRNRINDPDLGTILVSTLVEAGTGSEGVTITATPASPANGAVALTTSPSPTDSDGCGYVLKVTPGDYNVTVSRVNSIDAAKQTTAASQFVKVFAGRSTAVSFAYDYWGTFTANYTANYATGSVPKFIPLNLDTSFLKGDDVTVSTAGSNVLSRDINLYPWSTGYTVIAGDYVKPTDASAGCVSVDPAAWPIGVAGVKALTGARPPSVAALAGGAKKPVTVEMGLFTVRGITSDNRFLRAVSTPTKNPLTGDPGCAQTMTYDFGQILPASPSNTSIVALPWGSWQLYTGKTAATVTIPIAASNITPLSRGSVFAADGVLTLDPRTVAP